VYAVPFSGRWWCGFLVAAGAGSPLATAWLRSPGGRALASRALRSSAERLPLQARSRPEKRFIRVAGGAGERLRWSRSVRPGTPCPGGDRGHGGVPHQERARAATTQQAASPTPRANRPPMGMDGAGFLSFPGHPSKPPKMAGPWRGTTSRSGYRGMAVVGPVSAVPGGRRGSARAGQCRSRGTGRRR
jgi:hypothetical protein